MRTLYHGTSSVNLASIKAVGLVPGHAKGGDAWAKQQHWHLAEVKREPSVFVTDEVEDAEHFSHLAVKEVGGDPIVVMLHVPEQVFATYVVDELFERDADTPHAWRAHSVDPAYVGKALPVSADPMHELIALLASRLAEMEGAHHAR